MLTTRRGVLVGLSCTVPSMVLARDTSNQWAQSPNREWFSQLRNEAGNRCCDDGDGRRIEDPDWQKTEKGFRVKMEPKGPWIDVPPKAVVTEHNKVGYAMIWRSWDECTATWLIVCFMPGNET